jgi:transmembrane sensor
MTETAPHVLDEAARWYARLGAPDCTDLDRAGYIRWRRENAGHEEADAVAKRFLADIDRLVATDHRLSVLAEEALAEGRATRKRRWLVPAAIAGCLMVEGVFVYAWIHRRAPEVEPVSLATAAREQGNVTLGDGSRVHLDVLSSLTVRITRKERSIELKGGRALFEVAHDASRPFVVHTGNGNVTALGTRFQVQRDDERVIVTLAEGTVRVSQEITGGSLHEERLKPGEQLTYSTDGSYWERRSVDSAAAVSWSSGRLVFRGAPIVQALAEMNRYSTRKIRIGDPSLNALEVSGTFALGDTASVVSALTQVLSLRAVDDRDETTLLPAR